MGTRIVLVLGLGVFVSFCTHAAEPSASQRWDFEDVAVGKLPEGWRVEGTNQDGPLATWEVVMEKDASKESKALALTKPNHTTRGTFNLCWTDKVRFKDGEISVRLKGNTGEVDQGGGVIWRARDKDNYYICRANPLENNLRLYWVKEGKRTMLKSEEIDMPAGQWHTLRITQDGARIQCFLGDAIAMEVEDTTFTEPGGIGLWTKADAATSFDDLEIRPRAASEAPSPSATSK